MPAPDWRVVIQKDGLYLAEDRHGPVGTFWANLESPFVLWFDTADQAKRHAPSESELELVNVAAFRLHDDGYHARFIDPDHLSKEERERISKLFDDAKNLPDDPESDSYEPDPVL